MLTGLRIRIVVLETWELQAVRDKARRNTAVAF